VGGVRLRRLRGLYVRIALVAIAAGIVAVIAVYLLVVPSLQGDLEKQRLNRLLEQAYGNGVAVRVFADATQGNGLAGVRPQNGVSLLAYSTNARISVWQVNGNHYAGFIDSQSDDPLPLPPPVARRASLYTDSNPGKAVTGFGEISRTRVAEVAYTLRLGSTVFLVLFASRVDDLGSSVSLVERRILTAGAIAILAAALLAIAGSYALTRRLRRLQVAAERLAAGSFDDPVVDRGNDEIADLARSLDAMRVQLGRVENARRTFIANASHELRTPLTALGGFLELASEHDADPAARDGFLATMREQVDRLAKLATDLLDLSRLDAGGVAVAHEDVELAGIAEDCVRELRGVAARRGSTVTTVLGASELHAQGDDARVRQVLRALLDNSLRHTPAGSRIVVTVEQRDGVARLEVCDNGPGIAPEDQAHLFERFYRAPNAAPQGSGLGLAIANELAQRMGGRVEVVSEPGDTRFALVLPRASS
jgi:two-component system, OmpR family, sensor kinase